MKYIVALNGKKYEVEVEEGQAVVTGVTVDPNAGAVAVAAPAPAAAPVAAPVAAPAPAAPAAPAAPGAGTQIPSPMPGTILKVNVAVGQDVKAGDVLFILEAMKMENDIVAPVDGKVAQILVDKGATVATDDILAVIG